MKNRSATPTTTLTTTYLATGFIIAGIAASGLATACARNADAGPEADIASRDAELACVADYAIAGNTAIAEMTAASPRAESPHEQAAIRTDGTLLAHVDRDWHACPADFRSSRDIALGARTDFVAVVATFRGGNFSPDDYKRLTAPMAVLDAAMADFTAIYAGYLDEPAVVARLDAWLEGTSPAPAPAQ